MVANKATRRLTQKEEVFCQLVARGTPFVDAYRQAYNSASPNARINAYRVGRRPQVVARVRELQTPDDKRLFLTRARKRELLLQFAEDTRASKLERQRAIVIDNRMTGDDRLVVNVEGEITLSSVFKALCNSPALPGGGEVFDIAPASPAFPPRNEQAAAPEAAVADVRHVKPDGETPAKSPTGEAETSAGAPIKGPFDEDMSVLTEKPPRRRISRTY